MGRIRFEDGKQGYKLWKTQRKLIGHRHISKSLAQNYHRKSQLPFWKTSGSRESANYPNRDRNTFERRFLPRCEDQRCDTNCILITGASVATSLHMSPTGSGRRTNVRYRTINNAPKRGIRERAGDPVRNIIQKK